MHVGALLKAYISTNKHNQVIFKIYREMLKELAWYWCFFFAQLIRYVCLFFFFLVREERFAKHLIMVESYLNLQDMRV